MTKADNPRAVAGDNSGGPVSLTTQAATDQLKSIVERIERLEEEKKGISDDIRDIYAKSKGDGFDVKALRRIVRMRKEDPDERAEFEAILDTYAHALGIFA
jgi:uncharacterized protein (UPF0335 family)